MDIKELPLEKRMRLFLNECAEDVSRTHKCDKCGSMKGARMYEHVDAEMESLMPEHSAVGNCLNCNAVVMYTFLDIWADEGDYPDGQVPVEYRVLS